MAKNENYKYKQKIDSMFGINLPPRKKKIAKSFITLRFVLTGTLPSKKNMWIPATNFRPIRNKADKSKSVSEVLAFISERIKCYIRPNNKFKEWEERTKKVIVEQAAYYSNLYKKYGVTFPLSDCSLAMYCYWRENKERDNVNKLESVQDILTDSGIIVSDSWQKLNPVTVESEWYGDNILYDIVVIDLTIRSEKTYKELIEQVKQASIAQEEAGGTTIQSSVRILQAISQEDLMVLEWLEQGYDDENDEETYIDMTPAPEDWSKEEVEKLKELGYNIDDLKEYYRNQQE